MGDPRAKRRRILGALLGPAVAAAAIAFLSHRAGPPAPQTVGGPGAPHSAAAPQANQPVGAKSPGPIAPPTGPALAESTIRQLRALDEIFASKNDNDPRLDTELRVLDEEAKAAFRAKYRALPREKLNERGTLVFLLGRNLSKPGDIDFLREVLSEPPCLSPNDCSRPMPPVENESDHHSGSVAIVLAYPQLTAIKALEKAPHAPELREPSRSAWAAARNSSLPLVSGYARKLSASPGVTSR